MRDDQETGYQNLQFRRPKGNDSFYLEETEIGKNVLARIRTIDREVKGDMKTPEEARKHWAEVLRSGRFIQGKGCLELTDEEGMKNCCLGVACRLFMEDGGELEVSKSNGVTVFSDDAHYLPSKVRDYYGLASYKGATNSFESLANFNDTGSTFEQIADIIESGNLLLK